MLRRGCGYDLYVIRRSPLSAVRLARDLPFDVAQGRERVERSLVTCYLFCAVSGRRSAVVLYLPL
jgi:hypothetical protein